MASDAVTYTPDGIIHVGKDFDRYMKEFDKGVSKGLHNLSLRVIDDIKRDMRAPKSGHFMGDRVKRSAPGESPAVQTAKLERSIFNAQRIYKTGIARSIGTNLPYGRELEYGRTGSEGEFGPVAARPWLGPALARLKMAMFMKAIYPFTGRI